MAPPAPAPAAPRAPGPALSFAEQIRESNASIENARRMAASQEKGVPVVDGTIGNRIASATGAATFTEDVRQAVQEQDRAKNLKGATFATPGASSGAPGGGGGLAPSPLRMVSPGGRRTQSWSVTEGIPVPEAARAAGTDAGERGAVAAGLDLQAAQAQGEHERAYLAGFERAHETYAAEKSARAERYQRDYDASLGRLDELKAQIREAQVDPYEGQPGLSKLMGGLAIGLGAFATSGRGGPNPGLEAVKHSIAMTIRKQEEGVNRLERGLKAETNFLGTLRDKFGDMEQAKAAAWVAYLEKAKVQLANKLASPDVQDPRLLSAYERAYKQVQEETERRELTYGTVSANRVVRHDVNAPPTFAGGAAAGGKAGEPDPLFVPTGPDGKGFQARSEKEAQAARGVIAAEQSIIPKLERLMELRRKAGVSGRVANKAGYETEEVAEIKSLQAQVDLEGRELSAASPGAMDKGMQEIMGQIRGDWLAVGNNPEAAAKAFIASIRAKKDAMQRGQGGQDERQGLLLDRSGNVVTRSAGQASFASPKAPMPAFKRAGE